MFPQIHLHDSKRYLHLKSNETSNSSVYAQPNLEENVTKAYMVKINTMNLGNRIKSARKSAGLTQRELADKLGMSSQAVTQWETGKTSPATENLITVAKITGKLIGYFTDEQNAHSATESQASYPTNTLLPMSTWDSSTPLDDDEAELPLFREVELSAGNGMSQVIENHGAKLRFSKATLRAAGVSPGNGACCFSSGDSMGKVVPHGATVGVDKGTTQIIDGEIYAIDHGGLLKVKYLYRLPNGGVRIRSEDREEFPDEDLTAEQAAHDLRIIGFVFWISALRTRNKPKN